MELSIVAKLIVVNPKTKKLLLIRRSKTDDRRPGQWDIPGGMVEPDERVEDAALRECREEVGIDVSVNTVKLVYTDRHYFDDDSTKLVNWLLFYGLSEEVAVKLSFEHDEYRWVSASEAVNLLSYVRYKNALNFLYEHRLIPGLTE